MVLAFGGRTVGSRSNARTAVLFIDLIMAGTLAGVFLTYSFAVMPGLATTDDYTFVAAFQGLQRMFGSFEYGINWPILGFIGVPLFTTVATLQNWGRPVAWWLLTALALSILTILISFTFHIPLNDALTAAGDPNIIDVSQVRADFREGWWLGWNHVRSATSLGAFAALGWALFLTGKRVT